MKIVVLACPRCPGTVELPPEQVLIITSRVSAVARFVCPHHRGWAVCDLTARALSKCVQARLATIPVASPVLEVDPGWTRMTEDEVLATMREMHEQLVTVPATRPAT